MLIWDRLQLPLSLLKGRAIVLALLLGLLLFGIIMGDFVETWRNGATL
jgi:hypothetical protein